MILHIGPLKKSQFKEIVTDKLNKLKGLFLLIIIGMPFLAYLPFHFRLFSSGPFIKRDIMASVAKVNSNDGTGSAFLVSPTKLITARHVVEDVQEGGIVTLDFVKSVNKLTDIEAKVIFLPQDENNDYAVLELLKPLDGMQPFKISNANESSINDQVQVIGYPGGFFSNTKGVISNNEIPGFANFLQLDAGAWRGNSGGPVILDNTDNVIGIMVAIFDEKFRGLTIAIKIDALLNDPQFKAKGINLNN